MSTVMAYYLFLEEYYIGKLVLGKFTGPDDMGITLTLLSFFTAYGGSEEMWGREIGSKFGLPKMGLGQLIIYGLFVINVASTLQQVITNLYAGRNSATFEKRYRLDTFVANASYMAVLIAVYLGYTQLTGSTILNDAPKLTTLAFGGEFL